MQDRVIRLFSLCFLLTFAIASSGCDRVNSRTTLTPAIGELREREDALLAGGSEGAVKFHPIDDAKAALAANPALLAPMEGAMAADAGADVAAAAAADAFLTRELSDDPALIAQGEKLYTDKICNTCHSVDGSPKVGPTFKGLLGKEETMADGTTVVVDIPYLRESIKYPNAKIVQGFVPGQMVVPMEPTDDEIDAMVAYILSLQ